MGSETILYYVLEETITGCKKNIKTHFWKKIKPVSFVMEKEGISIITVMIPPNNKGWKREKLLKLMQEAGREYQEYMGNADIIIQTELQQLLVQEISFSPVFWKLADILLTENFIMKKRTLSEPSIDSRRCQTPESVVLLLGTSFFPEEQIQKFLDMMQPYFPRINYLSVIYEVDNDTKGDTDMYDHHKYSDTEVDNHSEDEDMNYINKRNRMEEIIYDCMEMLYYEYGLVGRVHKAENHKEKSFAIRTGQKPVLYLDYGYQGRLPLSAMRSGGMYIDMLSSKEKEQRIRKKCSEISYLSPRKYLDTMVKSGYDKLVNQA